MANATFQFDVKDYKGAKAQFADVFDMVLRVVPNCMLTVTVHAWENTKADSSFQYFSPSSRRFALDELSRIDADEIVQDVDQQLRGVTMSVGDGVDVVKADPYRGQLEAVSQPELIKLLNEYSAKHPKKSAGAREVLATFGGARLGDIAEEKWPQLAASLRAYLEQVQ